MTMIRAHWNRMISALLLGEQIFHYGIHIHITIEMVSGAPGAFIMP